ncbi:ATP-binding protein [Christensenella intestinihominis]|uniref:ATP-binding protein n=1 Tax=Christensenella intestinihominis TaxID=1851429 RepID=UPI00082E2156|nr:ATP-binding protein [Christensenella intestinihominis]
MLVRKKLFSLNELNEAIRSVIMGVEREKKLDDEQAYRIRLVLSELVVNIFKYSDANEVKLQAEYGKDGLHIILADNGSGFETGPVVSRNVTTEELLMHENGRGVYLVKMMTDSFHYSEAGNTVDVTLKL